VDVELVEPWIIAVARELDLELHLVGRDGPPADRAVSADTRPAPRAIGATGGELSRSDGCSGFLAKDRFVGHLVAPSPRRAVAVEGREQRQMPEGGTPDCVNRRARWKARLTYHGWQTDAFWAGAGVYAYDEHCRGDGGFGGATSGLVVRWILNVDSGPTPDAFSFAILDSRLAPIPPLCLGDALLLVNLDSANPPILTFPGDMIRSTIAIPQTT